MQGKPKIESCMLVQSSWSKGMIIGGMWGLLSIFYDWPPSGTKMQIFYV